MASTNPLIVPVNVQALPLTASGIGSDPFRFRGAMSDFSGLNHLWPGPSGGTNPYCADPSIIDALGVAAPVPGVSVHWALPDGITRGAHDGTTLAFGRAPDRWLVTRVAWQDGDPKPRLKSWVLASDRVHNEQGGATIPAAADQPEQARGLGQVFDLDAWQEAAADRIDLTALGHGDVTFASYYPSSTNVFGLFDRFDRTLAQEDGGGPGFGPDASGHRYRLSYSVFGWFSDPAVDPMSPGNKQLTPLQPAPQWRATASTLPWTLDGGGTPGSSVYSGVVQGVDWNPALPDGGLGPTTANVDVAIGGSAAEALSAMLAGVADMKGDPDAELLFNAVQAGIALRDHSGDEAAKLHQALHESGFGALSGGSIWVVKPATPDQSGGATSSDTAASLPDALAAALNALNLAQQRYDIASARLDDLSRQVFDDWYRYILGRDRDQRADLYNLISGETGGAKSQWMLFANACGLLTFPAEPKQRFDPQTAPAASARPGTNPDPDNLAAAVVTAWQAVKSMLAGGKPPLRLLRTPAPRYWQPNEPVVLLRGPDATPVDRWGRGDMLLRPGLLPCRTAEQVVSAVTVQSGASLAADALAGRGAYARIPAGDTAQTLLAEARLTDPLEIDRLAGLLAQAGLAPVDARSDVLALQKAFASNALSAGSLSCKGVLPIALARTDGTIAPWLPLLLQWEVTCRPQLYAAMGDMAPDGVISGYGWNADEDDLVTAEQGLPLNSIVVSGAVVLTPHASAELAQQIDSYLATDQDLELADMRKHLPHAPVMAQTLSGFNQALVMRRQAIQLDIRAESTDPDDVSLAAGVRTAVGGLNDLAPQLTGNFSPLRSGYLRPSKLTLIDAFGRARNIALDKITIAQSLAPADQLLLTEGYACLPPRLAQPSRLQFRWLAASDDQVEMNDHPVTSPIFGWVLPNFLDDSLMIYDAGGAFLGSLELAAGATARRWRSAPLPGKPVHPGDRDGGDAIAADVADAHLQAFVRGVFDGDASYLDGMIRLIDRACAAIIPPDVNVDPSLAMLIGRPLALARAKLGLELKGLPAVRRGWDDIKPASSTHIDKVAMLPVVSRDDAAFTNLRFEVLLGHFRLASDGLVAYFRDDRYDRVFSPAATLTSGSIVLPAADPIALIADPHLQNAPEIVTLLLDPRTEVHARIGILPAKAITIPPDQYTQALKALQAFFYAGPVLTNAASDLPLPVINGFAWDWFDPAGGTWQTRPLRGQTSDRAAVGYSPLRLSEGWLRLSVRPTGKAE